MWTVQDRLHRTPAEWWRCVEMAEDEGGDLATTSFNGRSEFLKLNYWDHRIIPTIGQSHMLLFGLVKDFLSQVQQ